MKNEKLLWVFLILIFMGIVLPQSQKLFLADEIDYVKGASAIASKGIPVYTADVGNTEVALWHPPLYIYTLSLSFKFLGISEWNARMISILFSLGTLLIVYLLAKEVFENSIAVFLSCLIFLLNPFVIQNSLLVDIDNTVLTFLMSLFVFAYVKFLKKREQKTSDLLLLGLLFGVTLWAKFGTPPLLIASLFIYHFVRKEYKVAFYRGFLIGFIGLVVFIITWLIYTSFLKLPLLAPFEHNIRYLQTDTANYDMVFLTTHLWGFKNIIFWATPFFVALMGMVLIDILLKKDFNVAAYLFINGTLIFIEYIIVGSQQTLNFPKYFAPMMPLLSVVLAYFVAKQDFSINLKPIVFTALLVFLYYAAILKDPFLSDRIIFISSSFYEIFKETAMTSFLYILPLTIPILLLGKECNFKHKLILASLICIVTFGIYIGIVQSKASYATNYLYGQAGIDETVKYLQDMVNPNDIIVTKKEIAYYTVSERWYTFPPSPEVFLNLTARERIPYIILSKEGYYVTKSRAEVMKVVEEKYSLEAQFGDFRIYRIKE